jgi:hypothetical protein
MPPDPYRFQKATQDFQSAWLFGADECRVMGIEQTIDYALFIDS